MVLVWAVLRASSLFAQATETAVRGVVEDPSRAPLAGAQLEMVHQASGRRFGVTTDPRGRFSLVELPLGAYTATARLVGFRPVERRDLLLVLGDQPYLRFTLTPAPLELAPLVVEGGPGTRRDDRVGGSVRIDTTQLASLPTANRNFSDLAALSPLAGPQLSLGGQRWTSTGFRLDGVQAKNLLRAGEYNAGPQAVSFEAIREFEVNTNVYDVTQGRQGGGEIAAVTKSGTNRWSSSGFVTAAISPPPWRPCVTS